MFVFEEGLCFLGGDERIQYRPCTCHLGHGPISIKRVVTRETDKFSAPPASQILIVQLYSH